MSNFLSPLVKLVVYLSSIIIGERGREYTDVRFQSGGLVLMTVIDHYCRGEFNGLPVILHTETKWKEIDSERSDNLTNEEFFKVFQKLLEHIGGPSKVILKRDTLYCDYRYDEAIIKLKSLGYEIEQRIL